MFVICGLFYAQLMLSARELYRLFVLSFWCRKSLDPRFQIVTWTDNPLTENTWTRSLYILAIFTRKVECFLSIDHMRSFFISANFEITTFPMKLCTNKSCNTKFFSSNSTASTQSSELLKVFYNAWLCCSICLCSLNLKLVVNCYI
jgi:hypothetical protein